MRNPLRAAAGFALAVFTLVSGIGVAAAVADNDADYRWRNVEIVGGGYVPGVIFNESEPGLLYARTDIGGAYRWDMHSNRWTPLLDWVGADEWGLTGVDSIATDPVDPDRVYVLAGTYTNSSDPNNGAILRSRNRGRTWERTPLPFKSGGNMPGRNQGERLVIDPNDHRILYLGTRSGNCLWRSADYAQSWQHVTSTNSVPGMTVSYNFSSYNLYGYPAIVRGWHYGWNPTGDTLFPRQISATSSIPCTFNYSSGGSNMAGDFAYDMFLRWDNAKSTPQLEVMVWAGNDSWPIGTQTATSVVTTGGYTFDLWEGNNSAAGYYVYTFIPHGTAGQGNLPTGGSLSVDMKTFFNWLQANRSNAGHYNNSMYLDVVEAGLEGTRGNGWAYVTANISAR